MKTKTGLIYASVDGQTLKISDKIKEVFLQNNEIIEVYSIDSFNQKITDFTKLVIGSSIRYGVHDQKIIEFVTKNKTDLDTIKTAFFSVNLVARKPEKSKPETNPYVVKFFKTISWRPTITEVFAGKLDYKKYKFFDRIMIQFIMWMTKGPTDKNTEIEYTNWEQVAKFAQNLRTL